jgi:GT2 family glycosyltransferase
MSRLHHTSSEFKMGNRLVSVIVPTFNRAYCLGRAVDSALSQTYRHVEVIIVDDGSTDETKEMIAARYGNEPRVRYIYQSNAGVSAARNTGLRAAQGDFIALLDSDDFWKDWKTELQVRCLEAVPEIGMIWTDMEAVDPKGEIRNPKYLKAFYSAYQDVSPEQLFSNSHSTGEIWADAPDECAGVCLQTGDIFSYMILGNLVHTSTVMLTRARFESVKSFREDLRVSGEDYDFHLRTCREGPVGFLDIASIRYQVGVADQLTGAGMGRWVSQNFLTTILSAIDRDRARIQLSQERLDTLVSESYGWVGEELLNAGEPGASQALWRSLKLCYRPRTAVLLLATQAPSAWVPALKSFYRTVRRIKPNAGAKRLQRSA